MARPITPADMGKTGSALFANSPPTTEAHVPTSELKSRLIRGLDERKRKCTPFVLTEFTEHFGGQPPTVWARVATLTETDAALVQAYAHIAQKAAVAPPIERDAVFVEATKTAHILAEVFRDGDGKESLRAFPDAEWIRDHLTPYEVRVLLDRYNSVVQASQPGAGKVEPEWVAELALKCADFEGTNVPDAALQECSRDMLVEMFVRLSMLRKTDCGENAALRAAVEEYERAPQKGEPPQ